jgi:hypothetical protein
VATRTTIVSGADRIILVQRTRESQKKVTHGEKYHHNHKQDGNLTTSGVETVTSVGIRQCKWVQCAIDANQAHVVDDGNVQALFRQARNKEEHKRKNYGISRNYNMVGGLSRSLSHVFNYITW